MQGTFTLRLCQRVRLLVDLLLLALVLLVFNVVKLVPTATVGHSLLLVLLLVMEDLLLLLLVARLMLLLLLLLLSAALQVL